MDATESINEYRGFLKRLNYSAHTIKNYINVLENFEKWLDVPIFGVTHQEVLGYIDHLIDKSLNPKTINSYLQVIRGFYLNFA